jgi:NADPH2:quinone reductase
VPRAVVLREYGAPELLRLEQVPRPTLHAGEVRVRVLAAGVNRADVEIRSGKWPIQKPQPFPYVPGVEVVGRVIETGGGVTTLRLGDAVISMMMGLGGVRAERPGGYQEEVALRAADCSLLSVDIDLLDVAAVGLAGVTALAGFDFVGAGPDRRVLVTGAGGGVGSCAIALGKALGTSIVAVTRDRRKADQLKRLGADEVVVAPADGPPPQLPVVTGVIDLVGGPMFGALVEALGPGGKLCFLGGAGGDRVSFSAWSLVEGITMGGWSSEVLDGAALRSAIGRLTSLMRRGTLNAPPVAKFALADAPAAHHALQRNEHVGRVMLMPDVP